MLRAAALASGLLTLGVAAALYFGVMPVDTAHITTLVNSVPWPWVASPAAPPPRAVAPVPVSIAKARIDDVPVYISGIGALLDLKRYEDLVQKNFASQQQVDQQRALVDQYRAQIDNDEAQIEYARTQ